MQDMCRDVEWAAGSQVWW